jgi:bacterioferritin-associated ferredoxin
MYVCLCAGVTESQIRQAIIEGCRSMRALREELDVTAGCGKCAEMTKQILQATLADISAPTGVKAA